jgi:two-component system, chemotaxis family, response regulator Rcp1
MAALNGAIQVLLVEDSPGDARLVTEALRGAPMKLSIARDGAEALEYLCREGGHAAAPRPDLILLDLELPKKNGFEVLEEIKSRPELRHIPVVILTGSSSEENVRRCYELSANCFVAKKADWPRFYDTVKRIQDFWFGLAELPREA